MRKNKLKKVLYVFIIYQYYSIISVKDIRRKKTCGKNKFGKFSKPGVIVE